MGTRLLQEGFRDLREGARGLGQSIDTIQNRGERDRQRQAAADAESVKQERLAGLDTESQALFKEASENPEFTREDFAARLQPFSQSSLELGDPNILSSTVQPIEQIFRAREAAAASKSKTEGDKKKTARQGRKDRFEIEDKLIDQRKNSKTTQRTNVMREAISKVTSSAKRNTGAGDFGLIFNYMKLLDPNSVVRESEFRSAADLKSWFSRQTVKNEDGSFSTKGGSILPSFVVTATQKADPERKGAFLLPGQRKEFADSANELFDGQLDIQAGEDDKIIARANDRGADHRKIIGKQSAREELDARIKARQEAQQKAEEGSIPKSGEGSTKVREFGTSVKKQIFDKFRPVFEQAVAATNATRQAEGKPPMSPEEEAKSIDRVLLNNDLKFNPDMD